MCHRSIDQDDLIINLSGKGLTDRFGGGVRKRRRFDSAKEFCDKVLILHDYYTHADVDVKSSCSVLPANNRRPSQPHDLDICGEQVSEQAVTKQPRGIESEHLV
ncbi:hypothetical protein ACS0TY_004490 [Phlomoides rotata]